MKKIEFWVELLLKKEVRDVLFERLKAEKIKTAKGMFGIAEKGEGVKGPDDVSIKSFLLAEAHGPDDYSRLDAAIAGAVNDEKRNPWKSAVIDELVVGHIYNKAHESDPRKAVKDAIAWNCEMALDPLVSSDAQALIDRGTRAKGEELAGCQARIKELTEALESLRGKCDPKYGWPIIDTALSRPADYSALNKAIANAERPYWLCCGSIDPQAHRGPCLKDRTLYGKCVYATASEHRKAAAQKEDE